MSLGISVETCLTSHKCRRNAIFIRNGGAAYILFCLAQMDTLNCVLLKVVFQEGCAEEGGGGSWVGRTGETKSTAHTKGQ